MGVQGAKEVKAYFPQGRWYSAFDHSEVDASEGGKHVVLEAPLGKIPVHILEGSILPMGPPAAMTTAEARTGSLSLLVALNTSVSASAVCFHSRDVMLPATLDDPLFENCLPKESRCFDWLLMAGAVCYEG